MKIFKKAAALLLAVMMIASLAVAAAAAPAGPAAIVVKGNDKVPVAGRTFRAYKIMDATLQDETNANQNISYTVPEELKDFYAARYSLKKTSGTFDTDVVKGIKGETDLFVFARALLKSGKLTVAKEVTAPENATPDEVVLDGLAFGYYIVQDAGTNQPISAVILDTAVKPDGTNKGTEVEIKADLPFADKKINNEPENNAAIGSKVPFTITSVVPDMIGYSNYYFYLTDTLSKGLTFDNDAVIKVTYTVPAVPPEAQETVKTDTLEKETDYTVTTKDVNGDTEVEIVFKDFYNKFKDKAGAEIKIVYNATVNENAVIGSTGNTNKVQLNYSSNPDITTDGDKPDSPEEENAVDKTKESKTTTYVTGIQLTKTDDKGNRLTGAKFKLEGDNLVDLVVKNTTYTKGAGEYYKLKNGTFTKTAPGPDTLVNYVSEDTYAMEETTEIQKKASVTSYEVTVGDDGIVHLDGLAAGKYKLTELVSPAGYNKLPAPIEFEITWNAPVTGNKCVWGVKGITDGYELTVGDDGAITTNIVNKSGSILPQTGGMGTTIFYVVGTMLIMMSGVLLITRKRANNF